MVWRFLKKLGIKPPYDPAIPLLGIYPEETRVEKNTCIPLFIAALFTIARTWKRPRCPSTDEWIKNLWYIYTMEYYSAIKRNAFESVLMRWMNLEPIIQSEVSQKEKDKYCILTNIWNLQEWSILRRSAFFTVQLSHPYMTTGKTIALTRQTFVGKVTSLLFNMLTRLVITSEKKIRILRCKI